MMTHEQRANLDRIFDKNRKIETDEDLLELAELTESEIDDDDESEQTEHFADDGGNAAADLGLSE